MILIAILAVGFACVLIWSICAASARGARSEEKWRKRW
jgi:hypothetical protein